MAHQPQLWSVKPVEGSTKPFSASKNNPSYSEGTVNMGQTYPVRSQYEDARFVKSQELRREMLDASHSHPLQFSSRRHSELVLPSIEGDLPYALDRAAVSSHKRREKHDFIPQRTDYRKVPGERAFSLIHLDAEEPQTKKRRNHDEQPSDDRQPRKILIPLHDGAEDNPHIKNGPAEVIHYQNVSPWPLDRILIQLPPREARRLEGNQGRMQVMTQNGHVDSRSGRKMPGEERRLRPVNPDVPTQPQSPKFPIAFQPVYDQQSPISFSNSATSYREVLDQRASANDTPFDTEGGARVSLASKVLKNRPQLFDDEGRDMGEDFRNLDIDPWRYREPNTNMNGDMSNRRPVHASLQLPGTTYLPRSPQKDLSELDRDGRRQVQTDGKFIEPRYMQQQHSMQDRAPGASGWLVPVNAQPTLQQVERATTNPFRGHRLASTGNSAALQWSASGNVTYTSTHANRTMSRNHGTNPGEAPSGMHAGNNIPQPRGNTSHGGNENIRPWVQSYKDSGLIRSRVPGEVVVLE